ncbi:MAG: hypothetical protein LH609_17900 [Rudanella sp.]|nr:hypothetical protein [Rudanella sp.]
MGFFDTIFAPLEIKTILTIIEEAKTKFGRSTIFDQIADKLKRDVMADKSTWVRVYNDNPKLANNRVYKALLMDIDEELSTGRHHIYRGALGLSGGSLMSIADSILKEFKTTGYWTSQVVDEQSIILRGNIKGVG